MKIKLEYCIEYGKNDYSEWSEYIAEVSDDEIELAFRQAEEKSIGFQEVHVLSEFLEYMATEIEEAVLKELIASGDEYTLECQGIGPMDPEEINDLVCERDEFALSFLGLDSCDEDELDEWDANDLDTLPTKMDIIEDFEPESPFDCGWLLHVRYLDTK